MAAIIYRLNPNGHHYHINGWNNSEIY